MADGDISIQFTLEPGFQFAPDLEAVAALMRARLYVDGQQHDTFDDETRPTAAQATELITAASNYVRSRVTDDIPEGLWATARSVTALRAAMRIELSYWPEQANAEDSAFRLYQELFVEELAGLVDSMADQGTGSDNRIGSIPVMGPTASAYHDLYGTWPGDDLLVDE